MANSEMNCSACDEVIEAYLDGELNAEDSRAIESHVAECHVCAAELSLARQVSEGLAELTPLDCPDGVTLRVRQSMSAIGSPANSIAAESRIKRATRNKSLWQIAAVVTLVAAGVVIAISQSDHSRPIESVNVDDAYTPEEVALARKQLEWTLAYLEHVTRSSMWSVGQDVIGKHVAPSVKSAMNIFPVLDEREENTIQ
jgi:predicted anti-sigma-YlaC factor YlaD